MAHRAHIDQRTRQERTDLVDSTVKPPLTLPLMRPTTISSASESLFELVPCVMAFGLFTRQTGGAETVLDGIQRDRPGRPPHIDVAIHVGELESGDHAFGLEARIDDDVVILDRDDSADDNGAGLEIGVVEALFKELGKAFRHVD